MVDFYGTPYERHYQLVQSAVRKVDKLRVEVIKKIERQRKVCTHIKTFLNDLLYHKAFDCLPYFLHDG